MRFLILSLLVILVAGQQGLTSSTPYTSFSATFIATAPQWGTGYFTGKLDYDWTQQAMRISFDNATSYTELYIFNVDCGYNTASITGQFTYQYLYKTSATCPCETNSLLFGMPPLFIDANPLAAQTTSTSLAYWIRGTPGNTELKRPDACTKYYANFDLYIAINGANTPYYLTNQFWVDSNNKPAGMTINDYQQRTFTFTSVVTVAAGTLNLKPPATGCKCAKLIDLVISLDRSGSISVPQWQSEFAFTQNLTNSFQYGPTAANVGICDWNSAQWVTLDLLSGTSTSVVTNAVNSMTCCGTPPATSGSCCCCGTPLGGGLALAGNMLLESTRTKATKVICLLTDGCQNHIWDPTANPPAIDCGCPSEKACETNTNCTSDITKWYNWVQKNIPGTKIIAIGVGTQATICPEQLALAAGNDPTMVFTPQGWDQLNSIVQSISATACTTNDVLCPGCCGICTCGVCYPPVNCFNQDACNLGVVNPVSQCCGTQPVVCTPPPCMYATCDPVKGCLNNTVTCKPPDVKNCVEYYCDNTTIVCKTKPIVPTPVSCQNVTVPQCVVASDCDDRNNCTNDTCTNGKCSNIQITCAASTKCSFTTCKPSIGCSTTNLTCNDQNLCTTDSCDPNTGCVFKNITCVPPSSDPCFQTACYPSVGCQTTPYNCSLNVTAVNCTAPACNKTCYNKYICYNAPPTGNEDNSPPTTTVIIASTLTTAAVVGIVVGAVVLAAGLGGAAVVAVAGGAGAGGVTAVYSNPVYAASTTQGNNPLNNAT